MAEHNEDNKKRSVASGRGGSTDVGQQTDSRIELSKSRLFYSDSVGRVWSSDSRGLRPFLDSLPFIDFDDLLPEIGEFGLFQKYLFVLMIPFCFIAAFAYLSQIFMTIHPDDYYCFVHELALIENEEERKQLSIPKHPDGSYSRCEMYDVNYTAVYRAKNRSQLINTSLPIVPCRQGYVFDNKQDFVTATMEFGWVCKNDGYATYAQMIFFLGCICGCLGYGHFADHCGRLAALVSSCFIALFGSIFTACSNNFAAFAATRFVVGASYDTCFTMIYILVLEYVGPNYRTFVGNMSLALFYTPFTVLIPWMALYLGNWRRFAAIGAIPIAFGLFSYFILPESARWLVSVGKINDAVHELQKVAKWNRRTISPRHWQKFHESCEWFYKEEFEGRNFTIASIFKRRRLARYMLLMIFIWMSMSLVYDGHVRAASVLDKNNVYMVFSLSCIMEIPGDIFLIFVLDRFGRRWCAFTFTTLSGLFSLLAANLTQSTAILSCALVGRFFANICYNIGLQWAAEVLPTVVRAQGVALIHTLGFAAMLLSPPIIYLSHLSISLMLNILGVFAVIAGILSLFLPETLHQDLPHTLSDGDNFGLDQRIWQSPCCGRRGSLTRNAHRWHKGSSLRSISRDEFRSRKLHRTAVVKPRVPTVRRFSSEVFERVHHFRRAPSDEFHM